MADLLGPAEVPPGFAYPPEFLRVVELGLVNLEPWWIFDGAPLRDRVDGLRNVSRIACWFRSPVGKTTTTWRAGRARRRGWS